MSAVIPQTYAEWRRCIEIDCGLELNAPFIAKRLAALGAAGGDEPKRFARLYGDAHLQRVLGWFAQARTELGLPA